MFVLGDDVARFLQAGFLCFVVTVGIVVLVDDASFFFIKSGVPAVVISGDGGGRQIMVIVVGFPDDGVCRHERSCIFGFQCCVFLRGLGSKVSFGPCPLCFVARLFFCAYLVLERMFVLVVCW